MEITRQLYQLQELDNEIEQAEQSLSLKGSQLGDRRALDAEIEKLDARRKELEVFKRRRRDAEWQVDDITSKIATAEGQLYGGKITSPKELSSLQHEIMTMKARNDQLETSALEIIEQVEEAEKSITAASTDYKRLEEEWLNRQKQLAVEIETLKNNIAGLKEDRRETAGQIDASVVALYDRIRQQKKRAVAKVEQGICCACRISLSASALQKARSGQPVQCNSCGRILFIS